MTTVELEPGARVLLIRLSALGDVLFSLETLASLKAERPDVEVDFLIEDRFASLLVDHPQISRLLVFPRRDKRAIPRFVRELRAVRYHAVLDLHGILKSATQVRLARAIHRVGYLPPGAREGAHKVYSIQVALPEPLPHRADRGYHLLQAIGLRGERRRPVLATDGMDVDLWRNSTSPRVILHPGASAFAEFKRWPANKFRELATRLDQTHGHQVAISFGPGERELADQVRGDRESIQKLDGTRLGLRGLGDTFATADVVVAADTGPLHIAAAAGARVVALFGPKDPGLYGPRSFDDLPHEVLFHDVPCRPCRRRRCASPQCVLGLTVDTVERTVLDTLANSTTATSPAPRQRS